MRVATPTPGLPHGPPGTGDTVIPVSTASPLPLRVVALSTIVALLAAWGTYAILQSDPAPTSDQVSLTKEDPAGVSFTTFEGNKVPLSSLRGEPVLVNFFASTCVPCVAEMPALEQVHQELGSRLTFLGLAMQDRPEDAQALIKRTGITYRAAQDKDASVITALGGTSLPTTVLIDADGKIVATHRGQLDVEALRSFIDSNLGIHA